MEFAIIAPAFLAILVGIVVYSIYFATLIAVTYLASDTARASLAGLTTAEQQAIAQTQFAAELAAYAPLLTATNAKLTFPTVAAGTFAVTVTYNFASLGFASITLLPLPTTTPSVTVQVSTGSP